MKKTDAGRELNPYAMRLADVRAKARKRRLDAVVLVNEFNRLALTGVSCDNGCLVLGGNVGFYTDFRYAVMAKRVAPWLDTRDIWKRDEAVTGLRAALARAGVAAPRRIGFEAGASARWYLELCKAFPKAKLVDIEGDVYSARAVKTPDELGKIMASEALNDQIWARSRKDFRPGMTEKEIQRVIRAWMNALGDGEAFETIVCAGANAAECHHVPDDTVWRKGDALLVDMGVKFNGVCSDMTRCIKSSDPEYRKVYDVVLAANRAAIAAARPGMTASELDAVARKIIAKAGYSANFGHSLGHGVGFEIHEAPTVAPKSDMVLEAGMTITIEPGVYLPGKLGVRIEDLVLITSAGCEVLSHSQKI